MSDDLESSCSSETVKPGLPFFTPPPLDDVLRGIDSLDVPADIQFPPTIGGPFPTYRDPSALSLSSSSETTDSTGLTEDISTGNSASNSAYSFMTSDYPSLFELALCDIIRASEYDYVDPQHNSIFPDLSTFPNSFGPQLSESLQRDHVVEPVEARADDGPPVGISPHSLSQGLSAALQSPPPAVPVDPPADTASNTKVFTGPIRTKSACDQCGRLVYRKNLKSHIETHDPNRKRLYVCPESDCGYPFTRSNDLKCHVENINIHGVRAE